MKWCSDYSLSHYSTKQEAEHQHKDFIRSATSHKTHKSDVSKVDRDQANWIGPTDLVGHSVPALYTYPIGLKFLGRRELVLKLMESLCAPKDSERVADRPCWPDWLLFFQFEYITHM
jgi:hypothetical protein